MYKIVGADQKEYGPVTAEELRRWVAEGRADAQTRVQREGGTEWKLLGALPEFASAFAAPPPPQPTPAPPAPPTLQPAPFAGQPPERTNGMAIAGLALAIFGLFQCCGPVFSTLGLIFSCLALSQISQHTKQRGRTLAIAGVILSLFGYLLFLGLISTFGLRRGWRRRWFL
jgi:Domain of unknown function (DUF4190)/GYF domain 2